MSCEAIQIDVTDKNIISAGIDTSVLEVSVEQGLKGDIGDTGEGLPIGGAEHTVPRKASATDYDIEYVLNYQLFETTDGGVAIGDLSEANAYSYSIGTSAKATGPFSTAVGYFANATGVAAVAIGFGNTASDGATCIGGQSVASGEGSVVLGNNVTASHFRSAAIGQNAVTTEDYQIALGTTFSKVQVLGSLNVDSGISAQGNAGTTGSFVDLNGNTITVTDGLITGLV